MPADPILLTLFANRFMGIAEAMGRSLQQTATSTNIKERLDFSCALFAPNGDLIANAPHLPVHLGSMSFAVTYQIESLGLGKAGKRRDGTFSGDGIVPGDVLLTNAPKAGGSHLPDITVITPVFDEAGTEITFFVAARGHHADVGGILPGSMPPVSRTIFDEGANVSSFKIVRAGRYDREGLYERLVTDPARNNSGARNFRDVESDLNAQIAANNKGVQLINKLIAEYSLPTVIEYMGYIRDNAEFAVKNLLRRVAKTQIERRQLPATSPQVVLSAREFMDDGSPIQLTVTIDVASATAVFDFSGTGPEMYGNLNAPISVTYSAVIYCLRSMVDMDIPLNAGCLAPITLVIPENSILDPSETCAIVGGNVLTSQRVTDVVLKAFEICAASQGCCNNLTFGADASAATEAGAAAPEGWGYYETIAGGSGAGPGWNGESGVHTHMTNTRITDPEILERRYPVLLREFSIREGSGGKGAYRGGDGVTRDLEFLIPIQASILSERRVNQPYGMHGGEGAERGLNLWYKKTNKADGDWKEEDGPEGRVRVINVGGRATIRMRAGDRFVIQTPGGGGYGAEAVGSVANGHTATNGNTYAPSLLRGSLAERESAMLGV